MNKVQMGQSNLGRGRLRGEMSLVNARDMQLECSRVLHETLLVLVLM